MTTTSLPNPHTAPSPRVLVIDDDNQFLELLREILSARGLQVTTAADGDSGLLIYRGDRPDIVLTDIVMPGLDGLALIKTIRENDSLTPIIAMAANDDSPANGFLSLAVAQGANAVLSKPFDVQDLHGTISRLLSEKSQHEGNQSSAAPTQ